MNTNISEYVNSLIFFVIGMEGGPIYNDQKEFMGILTRPVRQKRSGAEVQVIEKMYGNSLDFKFLCHLL